MGVPAVVLWDQWCLQCQDAGSLPSLAQWVKASGVAEEAVSLYAADGQKKKKKKKRIYIFYK